MSDGNRRIIAERLVPLLALGPVGPIQPVGAGALHTYAAHRLDLTLLCAHIPHTIGIYPRMKPLLDPQDLCTEPFLLLHH